MQHLSIPIIRRLYLSIIFSGFCIIPCVFLRLARDLKFLVLINHFLILIKHFPTDIIRLILKILRFLLLDCLSLSNNLGYQPQISFKYL